MLREIEKISLLAFLYLRKSKKKVEKEFLAILFLYCIVNELNKTNQWGVGIESRPLRGIKIVVVAH